MLSFLRRNSQQIRAPFTCYQIWKKNVRIDILTCGSSRFCRVVCLCVFFFSSFFFTLIRMRACVCKYVFDTRAVNLFHSSSEMLTQARKKSKLIKSNYAPTENLVFSNFSPSKWNRSKRKFVHRIEIQN